MKEKTRLADCKTRRCQHREINIVTDRWVETVLEKWLAL